MLSGASEGPLRGNISILNGLRPFVRPKTMDGLRVTMERFFRSLKFGENGSSVTVVTFCFFLNG